MNRYRSIATVIDKWPSLMQQETEQQQKELEEKNKAKS